VPKYPDLSSDHYYYSGSEIYGQSFVCISLANNGADVAADVLRYDGPNIYSTANVDAAGSSPLTELVNGNFMDGTTVQQLTAASTEAWSAIRSRSSSSAVFTVFGKSASWDSDLYEDLVEPTLKLPFRWETWRRSGRFQCC